MIEADELCKRLRDFARRLENMLTKLVTESDIEELCTELASAYMRPDQFKQVCIDLVNTLTRIASETQRQVLRRFIAHILTYELALSSTCSQEDRIAYAAKLAFVSRIISDLQEACRRTGLTTLASRIESTLRLLLELTLAILRDEMEKIELSSSSLTA